MKLYIKPTTELIDIELSSFVALSKEDKEGDTQLSKKIAFFWDEWEGDEEVQAALPSLHYSAWDDEL